MSWFGKANTSGVAEMSMSVMIAKGHGAESRDGAKEIGRGGTGWSDWGQTVRPVGYTCFPCILRAVRDLKRQTGKAVWPNLVREWVSLRPGASTCSIDLKCVLVCRWPPGDHFQLLRGLSVTLTSPVREPNTLDLSGL